MRSVLVDRQLRDYLDASDAWRRSLRLRVETDELLRKGDNRPQRSRQRTLLADARDQIRAQLRVQHRAAFRGEVSVDIVVFAPALPAQPSAPKSVKRYLDSLIGLVVEDDRQVAHLSVRRFADDHPAWRRSRGGRGSKDGERGRAEVYLTITPLRLYAADYDRAFRFPGGARYHRFDHETDDRFWRDECTDDDRDRLRELEQEREA